MAHPAGPTPQPDAPRAGAPAAAELLEAGLRAWERGDRLLAGSSWNDTLHMAAQEGDARLLGAAHFNIAVLLGERGDAGGAREAFSAAHTAWSDGRVDRRWVADALASVGERLRVTGEPGPARRHYEAALDLRRALADEAGVAMLLDRLGEVACTQNRFAEARATLEEAAALHRRHRNAPALVLTLVRLARVALGLDRPADAQAWASAASAVPAAPHELEPAVALLAELVADAMDRGDWDAARTCALAAMACHPVDPGARVQFAAVLATVAWTGRDAHTALRWGRQALEALGGSGHPLRAVLLHDLGVLATEAGEPETARRYLEEALALERANDDQDGIIGALLALADLARRSGGGGPGSMATAT